MRVCIDPGHGGPDSGAVANGITEKTVNLKVALAVQKLLKAAGHEVAMTRTSDTAFAAGVRTGSAGLTDRGRFSVKSGADLFVSIHHDCNAGNPSFRGCSGFYHSGSPNAKDLAACITTRLHDSLGLPYAYGSPAQVHWVNLGVLRGGNNWQHVTACLVECAMLSATTDSALIKTASYAEVMGKLIVDGIMAHAEKEGLVSHAPAADPGVKVVGPDNKVIECEVGLSGSRVTVNAGMLLDALGVPLTALKPGTVHANGRAFIRDNNGLGIACDLAEKWEFTDKQRTQGRRVYIKRVGGAA